MIVRDVGDLEETLAFGIPTVVVGHRRAEVAGLVNVVTDSTRIGRMGAEHLLACGFKHFAFCGQEETPIEHASWSHLRNEGFAQRIQEAGFACQAFTTPPVRKRSMKQQRQDLADWLLSLERPVGIMACNDDWGVQVMEACKLAGLAVPDTVGVIGADNDELVCGLADPAMSSVSINFERAGYEAAQALAKLIRGRSEFSGKINVYPTHVVARRSTDTVAAQDKHVAKALRFIRDHVREPVSVSSVAQAVGLSRRALERRFSRELGRTVLQETRRVRTEQIARLLVETHLPVSQIADSMGFADVRHFARYFRAEKRMSPLAYRKSYGTRSVSDHVSQIGDF
jgi:LacI family transcriptional regulator